MRPRLIAFVTLVILLLPSLSGATAVPTMDTVRMFFQPIQSYGGLFIAEKEGYFAHQQIKITWVPFNLTAQQIPALLQGQLEVGAGPPTPAVFAAVALGEPLRIVADKGHVAGRGSYASLIVRNALAGTVKSLTDLRGRRVLNPGSPGGFIHFALARAFASAGVSMNEIQLVSNLPAGAILLALQNGYVDAAIIPPPLDTQAVESGIGFRLIDFADYFPREHTSFLMYGRTLLEQNRALGLRIMVAYLQGLQRYNEGPTARNVAIMTEYTKVPPEIIRKGGWAAIYPDGFVDVTGLRRYQDWLFDLDLVSVRNPVGRLVDSSFRERARDLLGIAGR